MSIASRFSCAKRVDLAALSTGMRVDRVALSGRRNRMAARKALSSFIIFGFSVRRPALPQSTDQRSTEAKGCLSVEFLGFVKSLPKLPGVYLRKLIGLAGCPEMIEDGLANIADALKTSVFHRPTSAALFPVVYCSTASRD